MHGNGVETPPARSVTVSTPLRCRMDKVLWARPGGPGTPDHVAGPQIRGSFSGYYRGYGGETRVVTIETVGTLEGSQSVSSALLRHFLA